MGAITYTTILYTRLRLLWMIIISTVYGHSCQRVPAWKACFGRLMLAVVSTLLGHSMASVSLKYFKATTVSALMMSGIVTGPLIVFLFSG